MASTWVQIVVNSGSILGMEEFGEDGYQLLVLIDEADLKVGEEASKLLQEVLSEEYELGCEFLFHTDGIEEVLDDPDWLMSCAHYDYLTLHEISMRMGIYTDARGMSKILECTFNKTNHMLGGVRQIPDLSHLDANKSARRLRKEANRRKAKRRFGLVCN